MTELKPCPFCGYVPSVNCNEQAKYFFISCKNEKCRIKPSTDWHTCKNVIVREWNRRASNE